jgi:polyisoprenoid-binding protein YceI
VFLVALAGRARADGPVVMDVAGDKSSLTYTVIHQLHTVEGTSKKVQGRAAIQPDGTVQVMLRAPVNSFESGNSNRDEHMLETVEAPKFPIVEFKGVAKPGHDVVHQTAPQKLELVGELLFHGEKRKEAIPVEVTFTKPGEAHVTGHFEISLDQYHVERPSLMLVKIEDGCKLDIDLTVVRSGT